MTIPTCGHCGGCLLFDSDEDGYVCMMCSRVTRRDGTLVTPLPASKPVTNQRRPNWHRAAGYAVTGTSDDG